MSPRWRMTAMYTSSQMRLATHNKVDGAVEPNVAPGLGGLVAVQPRRRGRNFNPAGL